MSTKRLMITLRRFITEDDSNTDDFIQKLSNEVCRIAAACGKEAAVGFERIKGYGTKGGTLYTASACLVTFDRLQIRRVQETEN